MFLLLSGSSCILLVHSVTILLQAAADIRCTLCTGSAAAQVLVYIYILDIIIGSSIKCQSEELCAAWLV